jgi:membrane protein
VIGRLQELEQTYLWQTDYRKAPAWQRVGITWLRTLVLLIRDLVQGDLNLRAMSLVYTTLLSMVPLIALSFSILKGFGVQNELDETLNAALAPLGVEKAAEITENLIGFVNNMNVGVLGAVGLGFLLFTVVSLMQKIEGAFNSVWRVRKSRTFGERFTTFLSAITVGPLLIFAAMAITGSVMSTTLMTQLESVPLIGEVIDLIARLVPFALVIGAFTFLYASIPNTSVRITAALTGGVVAGVLWELLSFGFAAYAAGTSNYQLIYATFATAIFFMIWLYLNWVILLIGASIAFYRQHPEVVLTGLKEVHFSTTLTNDYTLSLLARVGRRFYAKEPGYTLEELAAEYSTPSHVLEHCLDLLVEVGVLKTTQEDVSRYVPGVPFDATTVVEILEKVEDHLPENTYSPPRIAESDVTAIDQAMLETRAKTLAGLTLKQLALGEAV